MFARMGRATAVALGLLLLFASAGGAEAASGGVSAAPAPAGAEPATAPSAKPASDDALDMLFEDEFEDEAVGPQADPFETTNRKLFAFNEALNDYVFDPMVKAYRLLLPPPARRGVRRAIENLDAPVIVVNDILQMRFRDAAETAGSFALNLTLGWGGLFDAGSEAGLEMRHADFGQTLARVGVGSGPYLVLPVLGPSTVRDGLGDVVDQLFHPLSYILGPGQRFYVGGFIGGGTGISKLDASIEQLDALRESSIDFYAAMRSAYLQHRAAQIRAN